ncbi:MAG TPA: hypothetical protein DCE60_01150 [Coprococcus sp.]|nr:hypothetical protein [Coprococcus sp.]
MKKVVRKIVSMALACMLIWVIPISAHAETTESIIMDEGTENTMELIGQEVVHIKYDGTIVHELIYTKLQNKKLLYASQSDKVTCSYAYYYLGKDSKKQPQYQIVMNISSKENLKSSVLSTKAEGISTWHNNTVTHSGKTGTNTRTFVYTSSNPPSNPYCYAKATIKTVNGTYNFSFGKLTNSKSK